MTCEIKCHYGMCYSAPLCGACCACLQGCLIQGENMLNIGPDDNEGVNDPWNEAEREYAKQVEEDARDRNDNEHGK